MTPTKKSNTEDIVINQETVKKVVKEVVEKVKDTSKDTFEKVKENVNEKVKENLNKDQSKKLETIQIKGADVLGKIKDLIKEGNVRKITVLNKNGETVAVIPVTFGILGLVLAAPLAVLGAATALLTECTIKIERK